MDTNAAPPQTHGPHGTSEASDIISLLVCPTAPGNPRNSEGDIIELRDGRLLLVWSEYYTEEGWDGSPARISAMLSADGGRTWSGRHIIEEQPGKNVMSASLLRADDGDLLLVYYEHVGGQNRMSLRRSPDDGRTWGRPAPVTPEDGFDSPRHIANNARLVRLSSGRILLPVRAYLEGRRHSYCCWSDDDGHTWEHGELVPALDIPPQQRDAFLQNFNEPGVVELRDGRLLMYGRTILGHVYRCFSEDLGRTWSRPEPAPGLVSCCSPTTIRPIPATGDLLCVWNYNAHARTPLTAAVSSDDAQTWTSIRQVEPDTRCGYCYTSITFVGERVLLTYMHYPLDPGLRRFECRPGYHDLKFVSLPLSWFHTQGHFIKIGRAHV